MTARKKTDRKNTKTESSLPKVLIAGGAGFIGSYLCQTLLDQNCQVYCLDNLETGTEGNIKQFKDNKNFHFYQRDITDSLASLPSMDYVFHLAGLDYYLGKKDLSLEKILANSQGTKNLLEFVRHKGGKFLYGSSINVFNGKVSKDTLEKYFGEHSELYSHSEGKRFSETLTFEYFESYAINARIVRLVDVFGPRMNLTAGGRINQLFASFLQDMKISIPGQGKEVLHPTYVEDVVLGLFKAMFTKDSEGKVYTLGGMQTKTVKQFAHMVKAEAEAGEIEYVQADPLQVKVDEEEILVTQELLNWKAETGVKQGIRKTLNWLDEAEEQLQSAGNKKDSKKEKLQNQENSTKEPAVFSPRPVKPFNTEESAVENKDKETDTGTDTEQTTSRTKKKNNVLLEAVEQEKDQKNADQEKEKITREKAQEKDKTASKKRFSLPELHFGVLKFAVPLLLFLLVFLSPFILLSYYSWQTAKIFKTFDSAVGASKSIEKVKLEKAEKFVGRGKNTLLFLTNNFDFLADLQAGRELASIYSSLDVYLQGLQKQAQLSQEIKDLVDLIYGQKQGNFYQEIQDIEMVVEDLHQKLGLLVGEINAEAEFKTEPANQLFGWFVAKRVEIENQAAAARPQLEKTDRFLQVLPEILSVEGKKRYLILFQDSLELRPTGGFVSAVGVLTLENGQLLDLQVEDVYLLDSQLSGEVDPPEEITKYLGENNWYLRDANWSPDFRKTALQAEWFSEKETGKSYDGVIGVDWYFLKEILAAVGPVKPSFYNQEIDSNNLQERAISFYKANPSAEDGEAEKFLGNLVKIVVDKLADAPAPDLKQVFSQWGQSLKKKHFLLSFNSQDVQSKIEDNGWGGLVRGAVRRSALKKSGIKTNEFFDFNMGVDANVGINKANFYTSRSFQERVKITKDLSVRKTVQVVWENNSPSRSWPGGGYKNYFRLYVPPDARLIDVKQGRTKKELSLVDKEDITIKKQYFKKAYGLLVEVPAGEQMVVEFEYQLADKVRFKNGAAKYNLYWQKQPGTVADKLGLSFVYPQSIKPAKMSNGGKLKQGLISYSTALENDLLFIVQFVK
jgi:UDP-glucuronate decarboxylase